MTWHKLRPANPGGGRNRTLKTARMDAGGQLSMSHAVADMLGTPDRVLVEIEPELRQIRMTPTTPGDLGGFALSGGGNASYRVRLKEAIGKWPQLEGDYEPWKFASAVIFLWKDEEL